MIHNGLIHVDISWGSFSSSGCLSPLMNPRMATSGNHTYPNWLADIRNSFCSSSLMENPHAWPPTSVLWCRDRGYYNRGPKMRFQQSAQTSFELWISSPQRERANDFLAVVLSRPADAIQPRSLITHPDTETHTHVGDAYSTLCRCTHTRGGGRKCFVQDDIDAVTLYFYSSNCGSDRVLHATRSLAQVSCAEPCRLSGVPTDGCSERLWMHIVWIELHAKLSRCSASEVFQSAVSFVCMSHKTWPGSGLSAV